MIPACSPIASKLTKPSENPLSKLPKFREPAPSGTFARCRQQEEVMIAVALGLASVVLFGAHVSELYLSRRPIVLRANERRAH